MSSRSEVATFEIPGEPASKARARFSSYGSKTRAYTPAATKAAEERCAWAFRQAARGWAVEGKAEFAVTARFFPGTRQRRDVDNMLKLILDGLNGVAWVDDKQVTEIHGYITFGTAYAHTEVLIEQIPRQTPPQAVCEHCKCSYDTYASWNGKRRFCSDTCRVESRRAARERECATCGGSFMAHGPSSAAKYCGMACRDAARRTAVDCDGCGVSFTKQRCHVRALNYCTPDCRDTAQRARRRTTPKGTCGDCGGSVSRKEYTRCRPCHLGGSGVQGKPELP